MKRDHVPQVQITPASPFGNLSRPLIHIVTENNNGCSIAKDTYNPYNPIRNREFWFLHLEEGILVEAVAARAQ